MDNWRERSLCKGLHNEMFYPPFDKVDRLVPEAQYYALGKYACELCPVIDQCRKDGKDEEFGLWGGQSPKDRRYNRIEMNKSYIQVEDLGLLPKSSTTPLDVVAVRAYLKPHLKRRTRPRS